jgi:hypothetical protein
MWRTTIEEFMHMIHRTNFAPTHTMTYTQLNNTSIILIFAETNQLTASSMKADMNPNHLEA